MMKKPQTPEEWDDGNFTLHRYFEIDNLPDIECLIRLVKEHIPDRGNDKFLRARLLGVLYSQHDRINNKFWERHYHPKMWRVRYLIKFLIKKYRRFFRTKKFKKEVRLYNMVKDIV